MARSATPDEIKSAFRKLAAKHHPDRNAGDDGAHDRFKEINAAYQILSDPQKRAMFDRFGQTGSGAGVGGSPFGGAGSPFGGVPFDLNDIANMGMDGIFGDLLNAFGFGKADRGDVKMELTISFEEAAFGTEKEVTYERIDLCPECHGSGAGAGATVSACPACHGRGKIRFQQGILPLAVERPCTRCRGTGKVSSNPCASCRGEGLSKQRKTLMVSIPAGIEHNATHLVSRAGNVTRPDRSPGDLELTIHVAAHPFFRRVGDDVMCSVPVSFPQATLGAEVEVPTLEGKGKVRIPSGTQPGTVLRIRNKGIPRRVVGGRGDQLVEVTLEVPVELSDRARQLIEELGQVLGTEVQQQPKQKTFFEKLRSFFG